MSITRITCPTCNTSLRVDAPPVPGSRFKCPSCGMIFSVGAAPPPPAVAPRRPVEEVLPVVQKAPTPKTVPSPSAIKSTKPKSKIAAPPAAPSQAKGLSMAWLLGGAAGVGVAGLCFLFMIGLIGLVVWKVNSGKAAESKTDQQAAVTKEQRSATKLNEPIIDATPFQSQSPAPTPMTTIPTPAPVPNPVPNPLPVDPSPRSINPGDGSLSADVLQRTKQATVYIRVQNKEGLFTGSGFFEESSGLIVTNAHVLGMLKSKVPPQRIEVVVNSGETNQQVQAAKLVDIDRNSDLAILQVPLGPAQSKLRVLPAKGLLETQHVYVFGFPFGEKVNKNVTVSTSSISSLHKGDDGVLSKVQVNGGMQPGNSGGPVVDAGGNVIGVAVSIIEGTQINFAIPGEQVQALLNGRLTEYVANTNAVPMNGKYLVHVVIRTIDPRKQISRISLKYWTGPAAQPTPMPSDQRPVLGPNNSARQSVDMVYDANKREAQIDLPLDTIPDGTNRLWVQAVMTNGTGRPSWQKAFAFSVDPPVEPKPILVKAQYRVGNVPIHLTSMAKYKLVPPAGDEFSLLMNIDTHLNEETRPVAPNGAQSRMTLDKTHHPAFSIGLSLNNEKVETKPEFQTAIKKDVSAIVLDYALDGQGNLTSKKTDFSRKIEDASRPFLTDIGDQIHQSLDVVTIPQPGQVMQPGQTWHGKRDLPVPIGKEVKALSLDVTYTYRGVRTLNGRQVAAVELRGNGRDGLQSGGMTGTVLIDPESGMILQAKAFLESTLTIRETKRVGRTLHTTSLKSIGTLEIKLQRGPGIN